MRRLTSSCDASEVMGETDLTPSAGVLVLYWSLHAEQGDSSSLNLCVKGLKSNPSIIAKYSLKPNNIIDHYVLHMQPQEAVHTSISFVPRTASRRAAREVVTVTVIRLWPLYKLIPGDLALAVSTLVEREADLAERLVLVKFSTMMAGVTPPAPAHTMIYFMTLPFVMTQVCTIVCLYACLAVCLFLCSQI